MNILLIYNPKAGHKSGKKLLPQTKQLFEEKNINLDLKLTEYAGHGTEIITQTDFEKYDGVVVAGGDGMAFELINGYYRNPSKKRIPIGILPIGTGNAFARDLNLDKSRLRESVEIIAKNKFKKVDVGKFTVKNTDYYYLNILGFGFVADVSKSAQGLKIFGGAAYLLAVFYQTIFLNPYKSLKMGVVLVDGTSTLVAWNSGRKELISPHLKFGFAYPFKLSIFQILPVGDIHLRFDNPGSASQLSIKKTGMDFFFGLEVGYKEKVFIRVGNHRSSLTESRDLPRLKEG